MNWIWKEMNRRLFGRVAYELTDFQKLSGAGFQTTDLIDELEQSVCQFFLGITSPEESSQITINFRHSQTNEIQAQIAWLKRVEHLQRTEGC